MIIDLDVHIDHWSTWTSRSTFSAPGWYLEGQPQVGTRDREHFLWERPGKLSKLVKILAVKNKMLKHIPSPSEESEYYGIPLQQVNICKVTFGVQCLNSYIFPGHYFSVCPTIAEQPYFTILNISENVDLKISRLWQVFTIFTQLHQSLLSLS